MPNQWTKANDIALIEEYLGYETWTTPKGKALYSIDGNAHDVPDMTAPSCALTLDCLDSWISVEDGRGVSIDFWPSDRKRRVWLKYDYGAGRLSDFGEGRNLHKAVARALRAAVGR